MKRTCPLLTVGAVELLGDAHPSLFDDRVIVSLDWRVESGAPPVWEFPRELYVPRPNQSILVYSPRFDRGLPVEVVRIDKWNGSEWEFTYVDVRVLEPNGGIFAYYRNLFTGWKKWSDKAAYEAAYEKRLNIMLEALRGDHWDIMY